MFGSRTPSPQLVQAVQDFGRYGILRQHVVSSTAIDVETASEVVRITQEQDGSIKLAGWSKGDGQYDHIKRTYTIITGIWFGSGMWRYSQVTMSSAEYGGLKRSTLPKG